MPKPGRTQKQIAERYKGNLGYYRRLHPWRRTRLIVSLFTIFGGLVAIGLFQKHGRETFFNAGKISTSHAEFENDSAMMTASTEKGMHLPRDAFHRHPHTPQQIVFELPRPPQGFTATFASFWEAHPEFQLKRVSARDPDVLRFNHQRHFASDIPPLNGQKLDCNYCHQLQPDGRFYQRISFAANCQACHSLQFDGRNPEMRIPHGNVDLVRTFLRSLPAQYADYARLKKGIPEREVPGFVAQQIKQLRDQFHSGDELERAVFFTKDPYKPQQAMGAAARGNFTGCAFCHEVKTAANAVPAITKPILVDRWMPQANFNHAKHQVDPVTQKPLDCNLCHQATQSRETSDVLMPAKANCTICHSPQGKIVAECITCHSYHAPIAAQTVAESTKSVKQMLLGAK